MGGSPVVPERETVGLPSDPNGELRACNLVEEQVEDPAVLPVGEADDVAREPRVHEQCAFPGDRVDAHDGMGRRRWWLVRVVSLSGLTGETVPLVDCLQMIDEVADGLG